MLLAAADFDSIVRQRSITLSDSSSSRGGGGGEGGGIAMRAPTLSFDRVDRRVRLNRASTFRLGLDVRLTPLSQIDGYPTSTVPSRVDRSALTDST